MHALNCKWQNSLFCCLLFICQLQCSSKSCFGVWPLYECCRPLYTLESGGVAGKEYLNHLYECAQWQWNSQHRRHLLSHHEAQLPLDHYVWDTATASLPALGTIFYMTTPILITMVTCINALWVYHNVYVPTECQLGD